MNLLIEIFSIQGIDQLRWDWISGNFYVLNSHFGMIYVCNSELKLCRNLIEKSDKTGSTVKALALDPTKG